MSSKLPPQYLFALVLALCAAVVALFFTMYVRPRQDAITVLQGDLATRQTTAESYRSDVAKLPALKTDVAKQEADRAEFVRALPTTTQFGQVVAQIRTDVTAASADMKALNFASGSAPNLPAGVNAVSVNMDVAGKFGQLFQVLRSLETQSRFTTIDNMSLTMPAASSLDPSLEGKYVLTVYTFDPAQAGAPGTAAPATGAAAPGTAAPTASAAAPATPASTTPPAGGSR